MIPSKKKGQTWHKALINFLLCFFVGTMVGFIPFGSLISMGYNNPSTRGAIAFQSTKLAKVQKNISLVGNVEKLMGDRKTVEVKENSATIIEKPYDSTALQTRKLLIVVSTTKNTALQAFHLTRLSHALRLVPPPLLWIVVEVSTQSMETAELLRNTGVMYRHLVCNTSSSYHQRDVALAHIEQHRLNGIVYFAKEKNFYSIKLFEQLREIRRIGVWPVAKLVQNKRTVFLEGPVCDSTKVKGWHFVGKDKGSYRFHLSHSGFAFNSTMLWNFEEWGRPTADPLRHAKFSDKKSKGKAFIEQLVSEESEMEGLMAGCSQIMVWDMYLGNLSMPYPSRWTNEKYLEYSMPLMRHS